jgi:hypothetical protein
LPFAGVGCLRLLAAAAGSFDNGSTVGDLKPKIKQSDSFADDLAEAESDKEFDFEETESDEPDEPIFKFEPMPPFKGLDAPEFEATLNPDQPTSSSFTDDTSPSKSDDAIELDPHHFLKASPVSPGADDFEPLPLLHEPFPLAGPIADEFLSLFDECQECQVIEQSNDNVKKEPAAKNGQAILHPQMQHHWQPYPASYYIPPHPGYAPHHYAPHHYQQPYPYHRASYGRVGHRTLTESVKYPTAYIKEEDITDTDVVCGRGGKVNKSPGNKRFRDFIELHKMEVRFSHYLRVYVSTIANC